MSSPVRKEREGIRPISFGRFLQRALNSHPRWSKVIKTDPCVYCGNMRPENKTKEHVIPIVSGGDWGMDNVVGACLKCNTSRGSTPFFVWILKLPDRIKKESLKHGGPFV